MSYKKSLVEHWTGTTEQEEEKETVSFLQYDSENILEQSQSAVKRDLTKHKIGFQINLR